MTAQDVLDKLSPYIDGIRTSGPLNETVYDLRYPFIRCVINGRANGEVYCTEMLVGVLAPVFVMPKVSLLGVVLKSTMDKQYEFTRIIHNDIEDEQIYSIEIVK